MVGPGFPTSGCTVAVLLGSASGHHLPYIVRASYQRLACAQCCRARIDARLWHTLAPPPSYEHVPPRPPAMTPDLTGHPSRRGSSAGTVCTSCRRLLCCGMSRGPPRRRRRSARRATLCGRDEQPAYAVAPTHRVFLVATSNVAFGSAQDLSVEGSRRRSSVLNRREKVLVLWLTLCFRRHAAHQDQATFLLSGFSVRTIAARLASSDGPRLRHLWLVERKIRRPRLSKSRPSTPLATASCHLTSQLDVHAPAAFGFQDVCTERPDAALLFYLARRV